jgi:hypothetical protein
MLGLKSTGLCGLDPWLTIHLIFTSYFLAAAVERTACFADLYRRLLVLFRSDGLT